MVDDFTEQLDQLGERARDLWLAGATQYDVLLHIVVHLGGWTRVDDAHKELVEALNRIREGVETATPP